MEIVQTALSGVLKIVPRRFEDARGHFVETWNARVFSVRGMDRSWAQDNQSLSVTPGTIRGLHYQLAPEAQTKLVRVLRGRVLDVAVDIRRGSPDFGRHVAVELDAEGMEQLYVPQGFAHGFCTLEPDTVVAYKVDAFYSRDHERAIRWNDPALGIDWPSVAGASVSDKDAAAPLLAEALDLF